VTTEGREPNESVARLRELLDALPPDLARNVFTHASWTPTRGESYERLAFLGDSVLSLAITSHIFPRLEAERFGAGELTKIRAQTVSGRSCRAVAERLEVPARLAAAAPAGAAATVPNLASTERVLASITEAVIGACYLTFGYEPVADAVVEAFQSELADALENPVDFKSALQERLARRGALVSYTVVNESGPPHDRTFTIVARIGEDEIGRGIGRSKKDAEQAAAQEALAQVGAPVKSSGQ
jgi:ribonuclease III